MSPGVHVVPRYPGKEQLEEALVATARHPAYERAFANYWANPGSAFDPGRYSVAQHMQRIMRTEEGALTDVPPWFPRIAGNERIGTVPVMQSGMTPILIMGDPDCNKVQTMPGGGYATVKVELPGNWGDLMAELGYRPLNEFFLKPCSSRG